MKLIACLLLALLAPGVAVAATDMPSAGEHRLVSLAPAEPEPQQKVYIVQLQAPSAVEQQQSITTSLAKGSVRPRFNKAAASSVNYVSKLRAEQDAVLAQAGKDTEQLYSYVYALNGFAARMTEGQANKLRGLNNVRAVWEDEVRPLATNFSAEFLNLFDGTDGLRGARGLNGEDIVIGFIDSGVYPEHPALSDTQEADRPRACRSAWGTNTLLGRWLCRRYRRAEDRIVYEAAENWNGACEVGDQFESDDCNNKLIGARWFIDGAENSGPIDSNEIRSPRDVDGHGTHTATTAAGNRVSASIFGTEVGRVQGIAPRARVAAYKACWLRPGTQRASCNTSDLASAIDAAVADGVDVINYSVGSSQLRITAPDDLALLAATKAGVLSVVAAGNTGPNLRSIGSPAGGPWVITAGASTREGDTNVEAMEIDAPAAIAGRYAVREASFTPRLIDSGSIEATLVLADDDDDTLSTGDAGTTSDACEPLINDSDIDGNIALVQRGGCDFDTKIANAEDAGAAAVVVYSNAGPPIVMNGSDTSIDIPAVMVGQADGNLFIEQIDLGNAITARLDKSLLLTQSETGNVMGSFSSRGPGPIQDILKPDVTAPGINILAGFTPDAVNKAPDETFGYLTGTSMATPHVSGVAALLLQENPAWSPAAIKSALMTTARQDLTQSNSDTAANPFDFGSGHIVPNAAANPGLVFDADGDDYDAVACGFGVSTVAATRCDELQAAGRSFLARDMNQPNISVSRLANAETVRRRVTNVSDESQTFTATIAEPSGVSVAVTPATLTLAPGATAEFDVTLQYQSGELDLWRFGALTWTSNDHSVRSVIAVRPVSLTAPAEITTSGGNGSVSFDVEFGYSGAYTAGVHGLALPTVTQTSVDPDPTKTFSFRSSNGVRALTLDVPANQLYLRVALFDALTDGDDDLDLYVYFCGDALNLNTETCTRIGESGNPTSQERVDQFRPPAGRYLILVHGFETDDTTGGPGTVFSLLTWNFGEMDDRGNMTVTAPSFVNSGSTETLTVDWSGLASNTIYMGGISHNTPSGVSGLTLITIGN